MSKRRGGARIKNLCCLVTALAVVVSACGGMDAEPRDDYRRVLEERYVPLEQALNAAVQPCQTEDFPACRRHTARALEHTRMLLDALTDTEAPQRLEDAHRQFTRGLSALAEVLEQTLPAIEARDDDEVARLHIEQHIASVDVNNPLGTFNEELGTELRPH